LRPQEDILLDIQRQMQGGEMMDHFECASSHAAASSSEKEYS
jgi:hypothetical protein